MFEMRSSAPAADATCDVITSDVPRAACETQRQLLQALLDPRAYPHPVKEVQRLETHSACVLLTGRYAYKIKKAVDLGFLDFTRLEQRRFFCEEELRLNRRLAPDLYLAVEPIGRLADGVRIGSATPAIEYAVKMREFPQAALLDRSLTEGRVSPAQIDMLADRIADFHGRVAQAAAADGYGTPTAVWLPASENFEQLRTALRTLGDNAANLDLLDQLETWSRDEYIRLRHLLAARKYDGFVRECHGDLHLGNIAWFDDTLQIFDAIDFNANLRWIDVMSEAAFMIIDLEERGWPEYAYRFLNRYLDATGDHAGLPLLPFYRVYRALVRAKVACIRAIQEGPDAWQEQSAICTQYLACARRATLPRQRWMLLMHGFSGTGKSTTAERIIERFGALRLRSDVERKRLCGLPLQARSEVLADSDIYDEETTHATYRCLTQLARQVLDAGYPVVVDAASLKAWQRELFRSLARSQAIPFRLVSCHAAESPLQQRLQSREAASLDLSDAGVATLRHQMQHSEPLTEVELEETWHLYDGDDSADGVLHRIREEILV